eukprot:5921186-Pyramimonas_sp.AAC.1
MGRGLSTPGCTSDGGRCLPALPWGVGRERRLVRHPESGPCACLAVQCSILMSGAVRVPMRR